MTATNTARRVDPAAAFSEHHAFIRARLRGLGVAEADLDDAAQDVFEVLVRRIADYDDRYPVRGWMAGIARRVARRYRERGKRVVVPMDEERAASGERPDEQVARGEAWALLQEFLDELEPERWAVFVLSEVEGLRGSEIAAELGVNQNTVYARLRSARTAFERKLHRHHARERRGLWALLPAWLGGSSKPGWVVPVVGTVTLGGLLSIGFGLGRCGAEPEPTRAQSEAPAAEVVEPTAASGVEARETDPAGAEPEAKTRSRRVPDAEGWYAAGSGMHTNANAKGEGYALSRENRYRLDEDRVVFEVTYIGDDDVDVDDVSGKCGGDGLEVVEGKGEWSIDVPSGTTRVVSTTLRATRDGVVLLDCGRRLRLVKEAGKLRHCEGDECLAPTAPEDEALSGKTITVNVANECQVEKQFVLYAGYPDSRPPPDARVYTFEPGERRRMKIDAAQWFLDRRPDGSISGGVTTDTDGAWVRFSGDGDACDRSSTSSRSDD